jgi:hypothetical protein
MTTTETKLQPLSWAQITRRSVPFQIIFDPKLKQRDHIDWLLAPWRDLTFMKLEVDRIVV